MGMNLYGFGNIPANLIPGWNPNLLTTMALMKQAASANQSAANTSRDSDSSAVTLDDELEEGEISPPDTPTLPVNIKKEVDDEEKIREAERKEEERIRKEEKEREAEIAKKKEKERLEKEREKQREEERQKLILLSKERDRLEEK